MFCENNPNSPRLEFLCKKQKMKICIPTHWRYDSPIITRGSVLCSLSGLGWFQSQKLIQSCDLCIDQVEGYSRQSAASLCSAQSYTNGKPQFPPWTLHLDACTWRWCMRPLCPLSLSCPLSFPLQLPVVLSRQLNRALLRHVVHITDHFFCKIDQSSIYPTVYITSWRLYRADCGLTLLNSHMQHGNFFLRQ